MVSENWQEYRAIAKANDTAYADFKVVESQQYENLCVITMDNGERFEIPAGSEERSLLPRVGQVVRLYGVTRFRGHPRGVDIDGHELYYRAPDEPRRAGDYDSVDIDRVLTAIQARSDLPIFVEGFLFMPRFLS